MKIIKRLFFYYHTLSILKKFLLAPLFGLIFVLPFYVYIFFNMLEMKQYVKDVNSELMPLHEISCDNILLLENIINEMNSAVSAKEIEWVNLSDKNAQKIRENLNRYMQSSYKKELRESLSAFNEYYRSVKNVSTKIIQNSYNYENIENETKILVQNYKDIDKKLQNLKSKTKTDIENNIDSLYKNTNFILLNGNLIFLLWFFISTVIIFLVHIDMKRRIKKIVEDSKEIANGDVDFDKRLCIVSYDELGQIVKSINIFINKLQKSHENLSKAKDRLNKLYITDRLTALYNRNKIDKIIDTEIKKKKRHDGTFSVILIDIDHFKLINDTYGHIVGDMVLKEFADIFKSSIRDIDYVGRWGGEEFIIICMQTDQKGACALAEHLRKKIEEFEFTTVGKETASFGIASCEYEDDADSIVENADKALYRAKREGRNKVVCYNPNDI